MVLCLPFIADTKTPTMKVDDHRSGFLALGLIKVQDLTWVLGVSGQLSVRNGEAGSSL